MRQTFVWWFADAVVTTTIRLHLWFRFPSMCKLPSMTCKIHLCLFFFQMVDWEFLEPKWLEYFKYHDTNKFLCIYTQFFIVLLFKSIDTWWNQRLLNNKKAYVPLNDNHLTSDQEKYVYNIFVFMKIYDLSFLLGMWNIRDRLTSQTIVLLEAHETIQTIHSLDSNRTRQWEKHHRFAAATQIS